MSRPAVKVLVTAAGGALAPLNIRLLKASKRYDVSVVGVDVRGDSMGRYFADAFATVPQGDTEIYVEAILALVRSHGIDIVMPWSDEEAFSLSQAIELFAHEDTFVTCSPPQVMETILDKGKTYQALESAGLQTVRWATAETPEDLRLHAEKLLSEFGEFVVKPTRGRGNRGALTVFETDTAPEAFEGSRELHMNAIDFFSDYAAGALNAGPVVLMERLQNPAYDVDILCKNGEVFQSVVRERINPAGVPFRGNLVRDDDRLAQLARDAGKALDLSYLHDCDIMLRRDGTPVIIEINPRPSGSVASSILAGVPIYDDLIALVRGEKLSPFAHPKEQAVLPYMDCITASLPAGAT